MAPKDTDKPPRRRKKEFTLPDPPDGGYGWVVVVAAFLIHVIVDGASFGYGVVSKHIKEYYQASESEATLVGSLQLGFYLLSCPVSGKLVERWGFHVVCVSGSLLAAIGFATAQFSPNIYVLMITYGVIAGIGFGMMYLASISAVTMYFEKKRVLATSLATCGSGLGMFTFSALCGKLIEIYDWKNAMLIFSGLALQGCVLGLLLRPLGQQKKQKASKYGDDQKTTKNSEIHELLETKLSNPEEAKLKVEARKGSGCDLDDVNSTQPGSKETDNNYDTSNGLGDDHGEKDNTSDHRTKTNQNRYVENSNNSITFSSQYIEGNTDNFKQKQELVYQNQNRDWLSKPKSRGAVLTCLNKIVDLSLLEDPIFYIICVANLFAFLGAFIPLKFQVDRAMTFDIADSISRRQELADFLVSVSGISSTIGRAMSALLDVRKNINKILVYNLTVLGAGVACFFNTFSTTYTQMVIFSSVFTFQFGAYIALSSVVCCEMMGPEAVNNAFAIMCMLRGLGNIAGGPIAGAAYDSLGDYDVCFYIGGAMMTIGGICFFLLLLPSIQKRSFKNREDADLVIISMVNILTPRSRTTSRSGTYGSVIRDMSAGLV